MRAHAREEGLDRWKAVAVLATVRACAASWDAEVRVIGNIRARDLLRAIDAALPLADGQLLDGRRFASAGCDAPPGSDDAPVGVVLACLHACAAGWSPEVPLFGPVTAGEIRWAVSRTLGLPEDSPEASPCA